jgi:hypothetical protein
MNKNLLTFAGAAIVVYVGYMWYSKRQRRMREAEEKAKAAVAPIKVEIKESSGKLTDGTPKVKKEVIQPDLAIRVPDVKQVRGGLPPMPPSREMMPKKLVTPPKPAIDLKAPTRLGKMRTIVGVDETLV